jgi:hypothetical protein
MPAEEEVLESYYPHLFTIPKQFGKIFSALQPDSGKSQVSLLVDFIEMGIYAEEIVYGDRIDIPDQYSEYMQHFFLPSLSQLSNGDYQAAQLSTDGLANFTLSDFTYSDNKVAITLHPKMESKFKKIAEKHNTTIEDICSTFAGCGLAAYRRMLANREVVNV